MRVSLFNVSLRAGAAALFVVGLSTAAPDARAQESRVTVVGRMASAVDGSDVYGVLVAIPALRLRTRSDSTGLFRLAGVRAGTFDLTFRRIGYRRGARSIKVAARTGVFDLGTFLVAPSVTELEDLIVSAPADRYRRLESAGFYTRWESGRGGFADIDDLERWGLVDFSDILRHMPGFRVELNRNYGHPMPPVTTVFGLIVEIPHGIDTRRYVISSRRSSRSNCPPQFVLDGVRMGNSTEFQLDDINTETIVGVETYPSPAQVPTEFSWGGSTCGVIVIWTR